MPFLAHLGELRQRIIVAVIALGIGFIATFSFSERIITWLAQPVEPVSWSSSSRPSRSGST